ncbi:hypothetical protein Tco_1509706 [Tanacetum coccineum]
MYPVLELMGNVVYGGTCKVQVHMRDGSSFVLDNVRSGSDQDDIEGYTQQCMKSGVAKHLGVAGIQQQNGLVNETNVTLFAKVRCLLIQSGLSKICWGFFGWLASIKQGMLEPVKVKCIFLGYRKGIVGNNLWRFDDVTSKVLQGVEFEVEPQEDHTFEHAIGSNTQHENYSVIEKTVMRLLLQAGLKGDMDARSDVYVLSNGCKKCSDDNDSYYWEYTPGMFIHLFLYIDDMGFSCGCKAEIWATKGLLDKAKGNILGMEIVRDQSGDSDVEKNGKWSCIYAVGSQEYQMVCTRPDIASADVGMLDGFDHGLQTYVQAAKEAIAIWLKGSQRMSRIRAKDGSGVIGLQVLVKGYPSYEGSTLVEVVVSLEKAVYDTTVPDSSLKDKTKANDQNEHGIGQERKNHNPPQRPKVAAIASMCVQPKVSHRPFVGEVVQALKLVCNEFDDIKEMASRSYSRDDDLDFELWISLRAIFMRRVAMIQDRVIGYGLEKYNRKDSVWSLNHIEGSPIRPLGKWGRGSSSGNG